MLTIVKLALRVTGNAFDNEIQSYIDDGLDELLMLGIYHPATHKTTEGTTTTYDKQIQTAIIAYVKWKFGDNDHAERWEKIYSDKVSKLQVAAGYGAEGRDVPNGQV